MGDLTPEALAPLLWAAMCEDAETRYPGDPDSPRWDKLGTWGEDGEVARSGMLAVARKAMDRLAPAHAALTAELEEARGQLVATAAPGDTVVIAFGRRLTAEEGHDAYERFRRLAPGVNIVIADDVAAIEVHRPDAENARYRGALEDIEARGLGGGTDALTARQALEGGHG